MMIPIDPIMSLVVVVGAFAYYAFKGNGVKKESDKLSQPIENLLHEVNKQRRYERWLFTHQNR